MSLDIDEIDVNVLYYCTVHPNTISLHLSVPTSIVQTLCGTHCLDNAVSTVVFAMQT